MSELQPGKLLVADPFLHDENFNKSVVLLASYDEQSAAGFVLNHPLQLKLEEVMPEFAGLDIDLYSGGPVEPDTLHYLHATKGMVEGAMHVSSFLSWGGDLQHVLELLRTGRLSPSQIKFFSGYSGWGLGQLESELQAKAWFIADLRPDYIFSKDEELLWKRVMTGMGDDYAMLTNAPTDPRWN